MRDAPQQRPPYEQRVIVDEAGLGTVTVRWDPVMAWMGRWEVAPAAPFGTAWRLGAEAVRLLAAVGAGGCMIHTEGGNVTRRIYRRAGFRDIPEVPGLKVARVADLMAFVERRR
jgi:hypothetical protein